MASTIPYIGSKISLVSNSEIRYEGILYTINTQESTIALQSVKTFGTEGRKIPEIPASSEIYDFIIFRGQDIKDLTVLEGAQNASPMAADPAIMSMNQRPAGGPGKGGGKAGQSKGAASHEKGSGGGRGWEIPQKGGTPAWGGGGGKGDGWGKGGGGGKGDNWQSWNGDGWGQGAGGGKGDGWGKGGSGKGDSWGKGGGGGKGEGWGKGKSGGKAWDSWDYPKGAGKGKGKDDGKGSASKGKAKGEGSKGKKGADNGKGDRGGSRVRDTRRTGAPASGVPVGELVPDSNADAKKEFAEDFDFTASSTKFDKVADEDTEQKKAPLSGYSKTSSFFDNISCEATDRAAEADRPKIDREKAREHDKDTFGDTRRPPRPVGVRRGKGKGGGKWN